MNWYKIAKKSTYFYTAYNNIQELHEEFLNIYSENPPHLVSKHGEYGEGYYAEMWCTGPDWAGYYYLVEDQWPYGNGTKLVMWTDNNDVSADFYSDVDKVAGEIYNSRKKLYDEIKKRDDDEKDAADREGRKYNFERTIDDTKHSLKNVGNAINNGQILSKCVITDIGSECVCKMKSNGDGIDILEVPAYTTENPEYGVISFTSIATINVKNYFGEDSDD